MQHLFFFLTVLPCLWTHCGFAVGFYFFPLRIKVALLFIMEKSHVDCSHCLELLWSSHWREGLPFLFCKRSQPVWTFLKSSTSFRDELAKSRSCVEGRMLLKIQAWLWAISGGCWLECCQCFVTPWHWGVGTCFRRCLCLLKPIHCTVILPACQFEADSLGTLSLAAAFFFCFHPQQALPGML